MLINYDIEQRRRDKMHSDHRIIQLGPMEGKTSVTASGLVDPKLFTGENKLHATFSYTKGMWKLHYDSGILPGGLQISFTTFTDLINHVREYFRKRNIQVLDVIDTP